jgi:putative flippase GtrA
MNENGSTLDFENEKTENKNMQNEKSSKLELFWQFIKFGLVGVSNTIVNLTIYMTFCHVIGTNVHVANISAFMVSVFCAYLLQSRFVFKEDDTKEKRVWWKALIKTYVAYSFTGLFLTELLLFFWLDFINLSQYLAPLNLWLKGNVGLTMTDVKLAETIVPFMNMVITIPINFCVNKFWAYKQK